METEPLRMVRDTGWRGEGISLYQRPSGYCLYVDDVASRPLLAAVGLDTGSEIASLSELRGALEVVLGRRPRFRALGTCYSVVGTSYRIRRCSGDSSRWAVGTSRQVRIGGTTWPTRRAALAAVARVIESGVDLDDLTELIESIRSR